MKYIALTIGPIIDTLSLGRKTSEIWMASYLFSSFMKKTIQEILKTSDAKFLVPYVEDSKLFDTKDDGIGKFHDRFIFTTQTTNLSTIEKILTKQKNTLASMIANSIQRDEKKVQDFFQSYLQTYLFESSEQYEDPVIEISKILDSIELNIPLLEADEDYIRLFLNRNIVLNSALAKESFGKKPSFDSIEAIAAQENSSDLEVQNAKKYIAIIHADGDNLGQYIKSQANVSTISKQLFDFDNKAVQSIKEYGGIPLFIGGDDLLIFAPVINAKKETVFNLVDKLSNDYEEMLGTKKTTLSFGISITYYKYPLYEALEKSRNALFSVAKNYTSQEGNEKNAVAISAQKHSGQSFDFCIAKDEKGYEVFSAMIGSVLNENLELPHAIHHKLFKYKALFENIKSVQLADTFDNIFNEDIHTDKFKEGLLLLKELFLTLGLKKEQQEKLFAMLSTIKLIRGDR